MRIDLAVMLIIRLQLRQVLVGRFGLGAAIGSFWNF